MKFRIFFNILFLSVGLSTLLFIAYGQLENAHYRAAIPAHIELDGVIKKNSHTSIREGCGGIVFEVTDEFLEKLSKGKMEYLDLDLRGRGYRYKEDRKALYYKYAPWRETPVDLGEGLSSGMGCLFENDPDMGMRVLKASQEKGAYYTTKHEGELLLIPKLRILIFSYFG